MWRGRPESDSESEVWIRRLDLGGLVLPESVSEWTRLSRWGCLVSLVILVRLVLLVSLVILLILVVLPGTECDGRVFIVSVVSGSCGVWCSSSESDGSDRYLLRVSIVLFVCL